MSVCIKLFEFRKVRRNCHTDTVAHIGHPFFFLRHFTFAIRIFTAKIQVVRFQNLQVEF